MNIDITRQLGLITRSVAEREHEGKPARAVVATRTYDTDLEDLWDAITNPERLPRWFLPVTGELRLGGRYQLQGNAGGLVSRCEKPHHLAVTWEFGGGVSWVDVRLTKDPSGGTRLELEHLAHVEAHWEKFGPGAVGVGWDLTLLGLGLYVTSGAADTAKAGMEWSMSEPGKAFMRGSSAAWGQAAIASGTDRAVAEASAAATTAFYCGEVPTNSGEAPTS